MLPEVVEFAGSFVFGKKSPEWGNGTERQLTAQKLTVGIKKDQRLLAGMKRVVSSPGFPDNANHTRYRPVSKYNNDTRRTGLNCRASTFGLAGQS